MCTLIPVRTLSKFAVVFERNCAALALTKPMILKTNTRTFFRKTPRIYSSLAELTSILSSRSYAKSRDKLKKGNKKISVDESDLSEVFNLEQLYADFQRPLDNLKKMYMEQLVLKTNTTAIEDMKVKYNGKTYLIRDLAQIGRKNQREVILNMSDFVEAVPTVIQALRNSHLNLNPSQEGWTLIVPLPRVTREHREALAKGAKSLFNTCKESVRAVQNKNIKIVDGMNMSQDDIYRLKAQLTALGNKHIAEAESMLKAKEKELLGNN